MTSSITRMASRARSFYATSSAAQSAGPVDERPRVFLLHYEGFREATARPRSAKCRSPRSDRASCAMRQRQHEWRLSLLMASVPYAECPCRRCLAVISAEINSAYTAAYGVTPGINPAALAILAGAAARYPANSSSVGDGLNTAGFRFNATTPSNLNVYHARFDFNLTDRQTLFARGVYQRRPNHASAPIPRHDRAAIVESPEGDRHRPHVDGLEQHRQPFHLRTDARLLHRWRRLRLRTRSLSALSFRPPTSHGRSAAPHQCTTLSTTCRGSKARTPCSIGRTSGSSEQPHHVRQLLRQRHH